jgi:hypothetical protein
MWNIWTLLYNIVEYSSALDGVRLFLFLRDITLGGWQAAEVDYGQRA